MTSRIGIEARQARVDAAGIALMLRHPDVRRMDLDEWLAEHQDALTVAERGERIVISEMDC
jgi:hypothetical protein